MSSKIILERTIVGPGSEHLHRKNYPDHWERYEFAINYCANQKVIDVACGPGYGTALISKATSTRPIGLDVDKSTIEIARNNYGKVADFYAVEGYVWPIEDGSIDVIVSLETFEHLDDPNSFLHESLRVLKRGGILILSTPLNETESRFSPENQYHIREYSWDELGQVVSDMFDIQARFSQVSTLSSLALSLNNNTANLAKLLIPNFLRRLLVRVLAKSPAMTSGAILPEKHKNAGVQIIIAKKS